MAVTSFAAALHSAMLRCSSVMKLEEHNKTRDDGMRPNVRQPASAMLDFPSLNF